MPSRFIKESICTSDNLDKLSEFEETFFYRLIVNCDDFGRMDARPAILLTRLFPLRIRRISEDQITGALNALQNAELIELYEYNGKPYLQFVTWEEHQQSRATKSKYPDANGNYCNKKKSIDNGGKQNDAGGKQLITDDNNCLQAITDDNKNHRIRIRIRNRIRHHHDMREDEDDFISEEDARRTQEEINECMDAAEQVGVKMNDKNLDKIADLYAEYGKDALITALDSSSEAKSPLAYAAKILANGPSMKKDDAYTEEDDLELYGPRLD